MSTDISVDCRSICRPINRSRGAQNTHEDLLNSKETGALEFPFVNYIIDDKMCQGVHCDPGRLIVSNTDPSQTEASASGDGLTEPSVLMETKILVRTRDSAGNRYYHENDQVKVKIQNPLALVKNWKRNSKMKIMADTKLPLPPNSLANMMS